MGSAVEEAQNNVHGERRRDATWIRIGAEICPIVSISSFFSLSLLVENHVSYLQFHFRDLHGHGDDISGLLWRQHIRATKCTR